MTPEPSQICAQGRVVVSRAVTAGPRCDDLFHDDDGSLCRHIEAAVLTPEIAAVAATLVDLGKRSLPPHISETQQAEAYLALRRIAGGSSRLPFREEQADDS